MCCTGAHDVGLHHACAGAAPGLGHENRGMLGPAIWCTGAGACWMGGIMLLLEKLTLNPRMPSMGTGVGQVGNGSLELESLSLND